MILELVLHVTANKVAHEFCTVHAPRGVKIVSGCHVKVLSTYPPLRNALTQVSVDGLVLSLSRKL